MDDLDSNEVTLAHCIVGGWCSELDVEGGPQFLVVIEPHQCLKAGAPVNTRVIAVCRDGCQWRWSPCCDVCIKHRTLHTHICQYVYWEWGRGLYGIAYLCFHVYSPCVVAVAWVKRVAKHETDLKLFLLGRVYSLILVAMILLDTCVPCVAPITH